MANTIPASAGGFGLEGTMATTDTSPDRECHGGIGMITGGVAIAESTPCPSYAGNNSSNSSFAQFTTCPSAENYIWSKQEVQLLYQRIAKFEKRTRSFEPIINQLLAKITSLEANLSSSHLISSSSSSQFSSGDDKANNSAKLAQRFEIVPKAEVEVEIIQDEDYSDDIPFEFDDGHGDDGEYFQPDQGEDGAPPAIESDDPDWQYSKYSYQNNSGGEHNQRTTELKKPTMKTRSKDTIEEEQSEEAQWPQQEQDLTSQSSTQKEKFICPLCPKSFNQRKDLNYHQFDHIEPNLYKCSKCDMAFSDYPAFSRHLTTHISVEYLAQRQPKSPKTHIVRCSICSKEFNRKKDLYNHYSENHREALFPFKCKICNKKSAWFKYAVDLAEHYSTRHETPDGLVPPRPPPPRRQSGDKEFSCKQCDRSYSRLDRLRTHLTDAHGAAGTIKHTCKLCKQTFLKAHRLRFHMIRAHKEKAADLKALKKATKHNCTNCQKEFMSAERLKAHLPACRGLKVFHCDECGLDLAHRSTLYAHIANVHKKLKRFECNECGRGFHCTTNFKEHVARHTGLKPYKCTECDLLFATENLCRRHEKKHSASFECGQCGKKFTHQFLLNQHTLMHEGTKDFMCDLCGATFLTNDRLIKHTKNHALGRARTASQFPKKGKRPRPSRSKKATAGEAGAGGGSRSKRKRQGVSGEAEEQISLDEVVEVLIA